MKIGVLSDTHIPSTAAVLPPRIVDIFKGVDLILHAGDIVELSVLDALRAVAPVEAVAGNMDSLIVQQRLPAKKVLHLGRYRVGLIHGKFRIDEQHQRIRQEFGDVDIIVYGHSHQAFWGRVDNVWFLNPGSPTDTIHAQYQSVAILTLDDEPSAEIIRLE